MNISERRARRAKWDQVMNPDTFTVTFNVRDMEKHWRAFTKAFKEQLAAELGRQQTREEHKVALLAATAGLCEWLHSAGITDEVKARRK